MKYFKESEFACQCGRPKCNAKKMDPFTLEQADRLRERLGMAVKINSGTRCEFWNSHPSVKGKKNSQHLYGRAFDVHCPDGTYMRKLVEIAIDLNFGGIGVGTDFVHLDTRPGAKKMFGY